MQNFEMLTDRVSLTLDLLNPKSIGFDTMSRTTTVPSFKSFQSGRSSFHRANTHTHPYTHIVTKRSQYRRRRTTSSAPIKRTLLHYILLSLCTRIELKSLVKRLCFAVDLFVVRYKSTGTVVLTQIT